MFLLVVLCSCYFGWQENLSCVGNCKRYTGYVDKMTRQTNFFDHFISVTCKRTRLLMIHNSYPAWQAVEEEGRGQN